MKQTIIYIFAALLGVAGLSVVPTATAVAEETAPTPNEYREYPFLKPYIGRVKLRNHCSIERANAAQLRRTVTSCKDSELLFGINAGIYFNEFLGIETTIEGAKGFEVSGTENFNSQPWSLDREVYLSVSLGGRGRLPIGEHIFLTGRGGFHVLATDNAIKPYYGLGAGFNFNKNIGILAQYTRFELNGGSADSITANLVWNFDAASPVN